tara:strand:- start:277 stop:387 length:111 start_codon:yes stop_codon:yes gene_type:complete
MKKKGKIRAWIEDIIGMISVVGFIYIILHAELIFGG